MSSLDASEIIIIATLGGAFFGAVCTLTLFGILCCSISACLNRQEQDSVDMSDLQTDDDKKKRSIERRGSSGLANVEIRGNQKSKQEKKASSLLKIPNIDQPTTHRTNSSINEKNDQVFGFLDGPSEASSHHTTETDSSGSPESSVNIKGKEEQSSSTKSSAASDQTTTTTSSSSSSGSSNVGDNSSLTDSEG